MDNEIQYKIITINKLNFNKAKLEAKKGINAGISIDG